MGFFEKLHSKLELYRLEQRYTRRKNRTTLAAAAQYVDGEYIYRSSTSNSRNPTTYSSAVATSPTSVRSFKRHFLGEPRNSLHLSPSSGL